MEDIKRRLELAEALADCVLEDYEGNLFLGSGAEEAWSAYTGKPYTGVDYDTL